MESAESSYLFFWSSGKPKNSQFMIFFWSQVFDCACLDIYFLDSSRAQLRA